MMNGLDRIPNNLNQPDPSILGCLLGTAVGDALGLPAEGLSPERIEKLWGVVNKHHLIAGRGMISDDTEQTLMVAAALVKHQDNEETFQYALGNSFKWWFASLPAGIGLSTAKAIIKLWIGTSASKSGVASAGIGAAMRSAIIGVVFHADIERQEIFVKKSTLITHTDHRALEAALIVANAAGLARNRVLSSKIIESLQIKITSAEMNERFQKLVQSLSHGDTVRDYARKIGCAKGVSGFAPNTVAVALYAWLRHRYNFQAAVSEVISCGGDTDTLAAITGAVIGSETGSEGIPTDWLDRICDSPRSLTYIRKLALALSTNTTIPPRLNWPVIPVRNLFFLIIVLFHGFRRLAPPY